MATVDLTTRNRNNIPRRSVVMLSTIKFDDCGDGSAPVSANVYQLFAVPSGAIVLRTWYTLITVFNEGTSAVIDVGHDGDVDEFIDGVNIAASANANMPVEVTTNYRFTSDDTIDAIITYGGGTAPTTGEIQIGVEVILPGSDERYA